MDFDDFRHKISRFSPGARPEDVNLEFFYLFFQLPILYARFSRMVNSKLKIKSHFRPTLISNNASAALALQQ